MERLGTVRARLAGAGEGQALHVTIDGDRGPIQLFAVTLDYPLHASARY